MGFEAARQTAFARMHFAMRQLILTDARPIMTLHFSTDSTQSRHAATPVADHGPRDRAPDSAIPKMTVPFDANSGAADDASEPEFECRFDMVAASDAGLLPRALDIVARLDIAPLRCLAETDDRGRMAISLTFRGLRTDQARTASDRMRNIFGVESVSLSLTPVEQTFVPAARAGG